MYMQPPLLSITIYIYIYIYKGHSKCSKPHPERRAIAECYCWGQHTTTSYKMKKTNSNLCLNFYAGEAHRKMKGV